MNHTHTVSGVLISRFFSLSLYPTLLLLLFAVRRVRHCSDHTNTLTQAVAEIIKHTETQQTLETTHTHPNKADHLYL